MEVAPVPTSASNQAERWPTLVFFGALAALWLLVSYRLSFIWESSDQYSHGWFVPALGAWIFWRRWTTRPDPAAVAKVRRLLLFALLGVLLLPAFAANLVLESSPDWRMMMWVLALAAFLASIVLADLAGGPPWRNHLGFAFLFMLVAVPWPYDFETWLTVELSMVAATVTAAILNLVGVLAASEGNLIHLGSGLLGVEDACSGVRSFQSSFVVALLLGEWFRLRAGWRIILCGLAMIVAWILNVGRMLVLAFVAESSGTAAIPSWHDPAGFAILVLTLGSLLAVCLGLTLFPGTARPEPPDSVLGTFGGSSPAMAATGAAVVAVLVLQMAAVEGWYRFHERGQAPALAWTVAPAGHESARGDQPLGDEVQQALDYDVGFARTWRDDQQRSWELIYMAWHPGRKAASAGPHAPDYCQRALGRMVVAKSGLRTAQVGGIEFPYQIYTIADGRRQFHLLFTIDDGRRGSDWLAAGLMGAGSPRERRLNRVREGLRNTGQAALQVALVADRDTATAEQELLALLPLLVIPAR